MKDFIH